jgi:serine/threonine protein kinase/Tol biopolymer transport system component
MLGPYKVLSLLGRGGMGEVYKAIDSRLDRLVAIKVLPQGREAWLAQAIERFRREARAASALSHPNICTIHDIGEAAGPEGPGGEPVRFIVMELLNGETLQERLSRGSMDTRSLVDCGGALVEALTAAHAAGIIHRDIKPANIFLTAHGPKILDFGLAKTVPAVATVPSREGTASVAALLTDSGSIVGTLAYMSPEQLRGEALDPRSDLFSLGLVLYEMATGQRAFSGATDAVVSASILLDHPIPPEQHRGDLPPRLGEIVLKLLEKDRDLRYQTAAELRADLKRLGRDLDEPHPAASVGGHGAPTVVHPQPQSDRAGESPHPPLAVEPSRTQRRGLAVAVLATALVVAAGGYVLMQWRSAQESGVTARSTPSIEDLQILQLTTTGNALRPAISPDGKYVAYVQQDGNDFSLWIRQVATSSNVRIVPPEPRMRVVGVTVTPDGSFVDFVRGDSPVTTALWRVPFLGGKPTRIVDRITSPVGWSADGQQMAFLRTDLVRGSYELVIADGNGAHERVLAARLRPQRFVSLMGTGAPSIPPAWSLDGRTIAVPGNHSSAGTAHIVFVDTATGAEQTVPSGGITGLAWLDGETLLISESRGEEPVQLWRVTYPGGERTRLTNDVNTYKGISLTMDRGGVVTTRSEIRGSLWVGDGSASSGAEVVPPFRVGEEFFVGWAADRVLYTTFSGVFPAVWEARPGERTVEEIVQQAVQPVASPDGQTVVFRSTEQGSRAGLWRVDADGGGATQVVAGDASYPVVTNDGQLIFPSMRSGVESLWVVPMGGGEPTAIARTSGARPSVSPDGKAIAFLSLSAQNKSELVVCDLPACTARRTLPTSNNHPKWTPDGRGLAFVDPATGSNIVVQPLDGGPRRPLTRFTAGTIADFNWSRDGKRLAIAHVTDTNDIVLLTGLKR